MEERICAVLFKHIILTLKFIKSSIFKNEFYINLCLKISIIILLKKTFLNINNLYFYRLVIQWRFESRIKEQMGAFLKGFYALIPRDMIQIFDENELEVYIHNTKDIFTYLTSRHY